ncbi:MAG: GTP-binding protein [Candidatus Lokiarchaeota archaeon]|nr:GTP-binding protein [Candidatus Lokiarchaeota archaeon]
MSKIDAEALLGPFREFMEKVKEAMNAKNYKAALAGLNIAGKLVTDIQNAGGEIPEEDITELGMLFAKASEAAEYQATEKKEKEPSQLAILRDRGTRAEATGKKVKVMSVFLFGLDAAGKTTFIDYINKERFIDPAPTVGVSISRIALGSMKFVFNDVGGQEKYRNDWKKYWKAPDFMVFMVDASDSARFGVAKQYLWSVLKDPASQGVPLVVMSNKMDKPDAKPLVEVVNALDLGAIPSGERLVGIFDTSVKTTKNIDKALNFVASTALSDQALRHFVDAEITRLNRNLGEFYKAYVEEAKVLESEGHFKKAADRVLKAKLVQEELFKQGFSKAAKEVQKCNAWLAKLAQQIK